jgi:hypothetical protein
LEHYSRQKHDNTSSLSDRTQSRVVDPKTGKRTGPTPHKGTSTISGTRRQSSEYSHDVDLSVKPSSETDTNKPSSDMLTPDYENDFELYFTDPQQLLAIFTELEEQNLSLIQNSQDHEEQLEEISRELQITIEKKNSETESLQRQVNHLEQAITLELQKEKELMAKVG